MIIKIALGVAILVGMIFMITYMRVSVAATRAAKRDSEKEFQEFLEWKENNGNPNVEVDSEEGIQEFWEWRRNRNKFSSH